MNLLLKDIIMILSGIIGGTVFVLLRNKFIKGVKKEVQKILPEEDKQKIKELYEKGIFPEKLYKEVCTTPEPTECFNKEKLITGLTKINNATLWAKDITSIFNLRKLIIIGVIVGVIFGYGYYKGKLGKEVHFDLRGKEAIIQLNEHYLKIEKNGTANVIDKDGKVLKQIKVKDIPGLREALRPYGFKIEPILALGLGTGQSGNSFEAGIGASWFKWFNWRIDSILTNKGIYPVGVTYKITENSGIGISGGYGYKGDQRVILKYTVKF